MQRLVRGLVWFVTFQWLRRTVTADFKPDDFGSEGAGNRPYRYSELRVRVEEIPSEQTWFYRVRSRLDSFFGLRDVQQVFRWSLFPVFGLLIFWVVWLMTTGSIPVGQISLGIIGAAKSQLMLSRILDVPVALLYAVALVLFVKYAWPFDKSSEIGFFFTVMLFFSVPTICLHVTAYDAYSTGTGLTTDIITNRIVWVGLVFGFLMAGPSSIMGIFDEGAGSGWKRITKNARLSLALSLVTVGFISLVATLPIFAYLGGVAALISLLLIMAAALGVSLAIVAITSLGYLVVMLFSSTNAIYRWLQAEELKPAEEEKKD